MNTKINWSKRAWLYIKRNPKRTALLVLLYFTVGSFLALGLAVQHGAELAKQYTLEQTEAIVAYEADFQKYYDEIIGKLTDQDAIDKASQDMPTINKETAEKLADDNRVKAVNILVQTGEYSINFENVPVGNESINPIELVNTGPSVTYPNMMVYGIYRPEMIEYSEGVFSIVKGRAIAQDDIDNENNVAVITKELADYNNINIGDHIRLSDLEQSETQLYAQANGEPAGELQQEYEVIGIYSTSKDVDPNSSEFKYLLPQQSPKNIILVPATSFNQYFYSEAKAIYQYNKQSSMSANEADAITEPTYENTANTVSVAIYLLDDPLEIDGFIKDHNIDLASYTELNANREAFIEVSKPLDKITATVNLLIQILVVNAVLIITLITALTENGRKHEFGVLISMGTSKPTILFQQVLETLIVSVVGFCLSIFIGFLYS